MDLETIHQQQQLTNNNSSTNSSRSGLVSPTPFINGLGLLAAISANPTNSFSASSILSSVTTNNNNNNIVGYPYISKPFSTVANANALMMVSYVYSLYVMVIGEFPELIEHRQIIF